MHPEFIYTPESNSIEYVRENESDTKQKETFKISLADYEQGEYYIIKYLPSLYAEAMYFIDDIDDYK